uniref:PDZ domain-containing protein n=1 Tax=Setaria digitata TaxID=48799 RepID=A0A915PLD1_9BILA
MEIQDQANSTHDSKEMSSSAGFNLRLTVPKKHYSVQRDDSLQFIVTPVFDKSMTQKKTLSSPGTVLTVAGLFVVGITLVLSGIIVLCRQSEQPFRISGSLFIGFGVSMLLVCALLQRKNTIKYIEDLNQDLLQTSEERETHEEVIIETNKEGLGMRVDETLHVIDIGDRVVQTVDEARVAIEAAGVVVRIVFDRGLQSTVQDNIPEQYENLFKRREGFTYHYVQINYVKGCKFGLGIKHFQDNVIVSRIDPGSMVAQSLQEKDHIIDINGIKVTDKEVAKSLLKKNSVSMCIERPVSAKAKNWVDDAMNASRMQPPSIAMASDVREIAARQQQKMMATIGSKKVKLSTIQLLKPGIMRKASSKGAGSDRARIVKIALDERRDVSGYHSKLTSKNPLLKRRFSE